YGAKPRTECRLVNVELIRVDGALDNVFTEPIDACDEHHIGKTGFGVECEHHAADGAVGAHHLHHAGRERDLEVVEALVNAIGNSPCREQRRETMTAGVKKLIGASNVEITFVLAG